MLLLQPPVTQRGRGRRRQKPGIFKHFLSQIAVGEEEERFPAPSQAEINRLESVQYLPGLRAEISPEKHKCPCKPLGTWESSWLSPPKSITGSTLPGGSITQGLALAGGIMMGAGSFPPRSQGCANQSASRWPGHSLPPSRPELGVPPHRAVPSPAPACVRAGADRKVFWP